jgi:cytochrome c biogenesis protein CcdA/glutaredoxin
MNKHWFFLILISVFIFSLISNNFVLAQSEKIEIYFFSSAVCPHCAKEREFLENLEKKYPEIEIKEYEVVYHPENQKILQEFYDKYQVQEKDKGWVPATFTPTKYFIGFNEQIAKDIENCLKECFGKGETVPQKIKVPFFGELDISKISLPVLTVIFGTLDGFNPCAMWVLVILISLLLASKSRKKIALVGGTFIFAEGLLYFLFMTAWLKAFLFMGHISLIRFFIGIFGIIFGILRIRDFIIWKPGVCKVVDHSKSQEKLLEKMKNLLKPAALPATIFGTIALAFGVNLVEFFCSAGFPVMYTKILSAQGIGSFQYYFYLLLYDIFYMLDDFIVFGVAFFTLSRFSFSDKYNRYSTLIAGFLILILGILLIFKPQLLMFAQ